MSPKTTLVVGHYCHDTLLLPHGVTRATLGGSASYISSVLSALHIGHRVISKVGRDFQYFSRIFDLPQVVESALTTHFIADFTQGERIGKVDAVCDSIYPEDLPPHQKFDLSLAVPIVGEVPAATLGYLCRNSRYLLCDVQGFIRKIDKNGGVGFQRLEETYLYPFLDRITYLKVSEQEARYMDLAQVCKQTCVLLTQGKEGCTVYRGDLEFHVPAYPVEEVDPTGAGDCFLAGFAYGILNGFTLTEAVKTGNYLGALAVSQIGIPKLTHINLDLRSNRTATLAL